MLNQWDRKRNEEFINQKLNMLLSIVTAHQHLSYTPNVKGRLYDILNANEDQPKILP